MPQWLQNGITFVLEKIFTKDKVFGFIAGVVLSILGAALGINPLELKNIIANAPIMASPTTSTSTTVPVGK